jgi:sugar O-acyltransferase (sialic acid O-acetyltransferase NeuD family)
MNYVEILAERESANDESYVFIERLVNDGDQVLEGSIIALLEGSKAVIEIAVRQEGYIFFLEEVGSIIDVGKPYAIISKKDSFDIKLYKKNSNSVSTASELIIEKSDITQKFTVKALSALGENEIDDNYFSGMEIITEFDVTQYLGYKELSSKSEGDNTDEIFRAGSHGVQRVAVIGAGSAAILVYDAILKRSDQVVVCFFDNYKSNNYRIAGVGVEGLATAESIYSKFKDNLFDAVVISPGLLPFRKDLFEELIRLEVPFANVIHPSVEIGTNVEIGFGNVIFGGTMIGPRTKIGNNNFIATRCNFEHDNEILDHNSFGPSVTTSGFVSIGSCLLFGTGIFIEPSLKIGSNSIISSGSIIQKDIPDNVIFKTKINTVIKNRR